MIQIFNENCMDLMKRYPDKYFDLAIVDPPYGGGGHEQHNHKSVLSDIKKKNDSCDGRPVSEIRYSRGGGGSPKRFGGRFDKYRQPGAIRTGGAWASKYGSDINAWDVAPPPEYFTETSRISKRCIIWGGNYFDLPPSRNFIVWRKLTISENFSMAMAEFAWTNIPGNAKVFEYPPQDKFRFHPTQKPVALYRWLLSRYARPGWQILDTHLGSGTHALACLDLGYDLTACEIDKYYYDNSLKMINEYLLQGNLFPLPETKKPESPGLFD